MPCARTWLSCMSIILMVSLSHKQPLQLIPNHQHSPRNGPPSRSLTTAICSFILLSQPSFTSNNPFPQASRLILAALPLPTGPFLWRSTLSYSIARRLLRSILFTQILPRSTHCARSRLAPPLPHREHAHNSSAHCKKPYAAAMSRPSCWRL